MELLPRLILAAFACLWLGSALADDSAAVRLRFLLGFARYVQWPQAALKPGEPLNLCLVAGDPDMSSQLGTLNHTFLEGRPIRAKPIAQPTEVVGCHLLYLPTEAPGTLQAWLDAAKRSGALTVGDQPELVDAGGMIGLVLVAGHYRFDINLGAAREANLRLSSQLLKLARAIK